MTVERMILWFFAMISLPGFAVGALLMEAGHPFRGAADMGLAVALSIYAITGLTSPSGEQP